MIPKETVNQIAKILQNERLNSDFYDEVENLMLNSLKEVSSKNNLLLNQLNFFFAGDHVLNTNMLNFSPLVIFVSLKQKKEDIITYKKSQNLSKTAQQFLTKTNVITAELIAQALFESLQLELTKQDKIYIANNIIIVNVGGKIKLRIVVGYQFEEQFEYEYLGKYYTENILQLFSLYDKKDEDCGYFYDFVRVLKSIELDLFQNNVVKEKSYDILYFVENLVYNIPSNLLKSEDFHNAFINGLNYLKNANIKDFILPNGSKMFNEEKNSQYSFLKAITFIKRIIYFYENYQKL